MKNAALKIFATGILLGTALLSSTAQAGDFDISVGVGGEVAPSVYGHVNVSNAPYPALVINSPIVIARPVHYVEPVYMHVPPGHARKWNQYCYRYDACGTPVYFVRSSEYRGFSPLFIEPRYIYREQRVNYVTYGNRRGGDWDRGRDRRDDWDRRGNDWRNGGDRGGWSQSGRHDHDYGHGYGRGRDD